MSLRPAAVVAPSPSVFTAASSLLLTAVDAGFSFGDFDFDGLGLFGEMDLARIEGTLRPACSFGGERDREPPVGRAAARFAKGAGDLEVGGFRAGGAASRLADLERPVLAPVVELFFDGAAAIPLRRAGRPS